MNANHTDQRSTAGGMARSGLGKRVSAETSIKTSSTGRVAWERPAMMEVGMHVIDTATGAARYWPAGVGSAAPLQASGDLIDSYAVPGITTPAGSQPDPLSS